MIKLYCLWGCKYIHTYVCENDYPNNFVNPIEQKYMICYYLKLIFCYRRPESYLEPTTEI